MVNNMADEKIAERYSKLKEQHSLPELENLEHNFGLIDLESEKYPLVEIRKKMHEKLDNYASIIANLIEGDATLSNIFESKALDETSKSDLFNLYRKLMKFSRQSNILSLFYDENKEVEFIKLFNTEWDSVKQELITVLEKLRDSWDSDDAVTDEIINYLG